MQLIPTTARGRVAVALVLALTLVLSSCTLLRRDSKSDAGGDAPTEPVSEIEANSVEVTALWYSTSPSGQPEGGTSDVEISVEPSEDEKFKIAFVENEVLGSGDQWRASQWAGSVMALLATGTDPNAVAIEFSFEGNLDGPSAGALMTVGVAAALQQAELDPDVTMTGTINPDGSIGPVGGIPQKIQGAVDAGKEKILIPVGKRMSEDEASGQTIDVVELGGSLGVEVEEVGNVFDAYKEFTGEEMVDLPAPVKQVKLGRESTSRLEEKTEEWLDVHEELAAAYGKADPATQAARGLDNYTQAAAGYADTARDQLREGYPAAAFDSAIFAALLQLEANMEGEGLTVLATQGTTGLAAFLDEASGVSASLESDLDDLLEKKPRNVSDIAALTNAYSFVFQGLGVSLTAQQSLSNPELAVDDVAQAIRLQALSAVMQATAADLLEIGTGLESRDISESARPRKIADFFDRAADASMSLFETTIIPQIAEVLGSSEDQARQVLALKYPAYGVAINANNIIESMENEAKGSKEAASLDYARLGAALTLYVGAADLLARFYSLDVEMDPENFGVVSGFASTDLLDAMFESADERTRSGITALEENEVDPSPIAMFYEMAVFEAKSGEAEDQLTALNTLWTAQLQTQMLLFF
ncbi:MAG: hypothetical protein IT198_14485 [Acidimicrobiia bacterium]|nr:hypothetical protein [Acidimicrobiia bacterium]